MPWGLLSGRPGNTEDRSRAGRAVKFPKTLNSEDGMGRNKLFLFWKYWRDWENSLNKNIHFMYHNVRLEFDNKNIILQMVTQIHSILSWSLPSKMVLFVGPLSIGLGHLISFNKLSDQRFDLITVASQANPMKLWDLGVCFRRLLDSTVVKKEADKGTYQYSLTEICVEQIAPEDIRWSATANYILHWVASLFKSSTGFNPSSFKVSPMYCHWSIR